MQISPVLSNNRLAGPWQVVTSCPFDWDNWYIYNEVTHRYKKIGKVGARRVNYFDKAFEVAFERNERYAQTVQQTLKA